MLARPRPTALGAGVVLAVLGLVLVALGLILAGGAHRTATARDIGAPAVGVGEVTTRPAPGADGPSRTGAAVRPPSLAGAGGTGGPTGATALVAPSVAVAGTLPVAPAEPDALVADGAGATTLAPPMPAPPVLVELLGARISAPVVPVGVLDTGALQLPEDPGVVGWWAAGALPGGTAGNVVIAGHIDSARYGTGVLAALLDVAVGDHIHVRDSAGGVTAYHVAGRRSFPKADLPATIFAGDGPAGLVLVTCGGEFDRRGGHYADNIVVYAVPD